MSDRLTVEWTDEEREAVRRTQAAWTVDDAQDGWHMVDTTLDALAPFVEAREAQAAARALREAEGDYSHMYTTRAPGATAVAVVTCADLRDRADRIERGESS